MQRKAIHAGTFYPRFADQINLMIQLWLDDAKPVAVRQRNLGLIVPHAGYIYSGKTASLGYHAISNDPIDSFIILHPCHHSNSFDFSVSPFTSYDTPLGDLEQDMELAEVFGELSSTVHPSIHQKEHSCEIQLPLIKYFFPEVKIVPLMLGRQSPENALRLAESLYALVTRSNKRLVIIASTDLSHYHHAWTTEKLDQLLKDKVVALDAEGLWENIKTGKTEACGIGAILTLMELAKLYSTAEFELLDYSHSGMASSNNQQVVGYLAARLSV